MYIYIYAVLKKYYQLIIDYFISLNILERLTYNSMHELDANVPFSSISMDYSTLKRKQN